MVKYRSAFLRAFIIILLFSASPVITHAVDYTSSSSSATSQTAQQRNPLKDIFIQKLATIRDARKQALVQRIDARITTVNKNQTDRMNQVLDKLTNILGRISTQAATLRASGTDTTVLDAAIVAAQNSIANARVAVASQAAKTYTITITGETTLKTNVGLTVSQFRLDLVATHKIVLDARLAVVKAAEELAKLKGEGALRSATRSAATVQ